ncbi:hypothetical protein MOO17_12330 [Escherichia coli]|uniref:hypothetical protein n=1 Tax=Escherichia coli TaxID=562 RepID=UPI001FF12A16|nr:hypothetical protein [Escherichia coli]MCJ8478809.1 hypothetical protein [Escherichia coli]HCJ8320521.1 hypothetical protein [Escherichia coli]
MKSSIMLLEFYEWWLDQAMSQNPPENIKACGLCHAVEVYCGEDQDLYLSLSDEMVEQFEAEGLEWNYPFDGEWDLSGWIPCYWIEKKSGTQHKNFDRLAWVYDRLEEVQHGEEE